MNFTLPLNKMKKSKYISLVLITAALASCHKKEKGWDQEEPKVYMRSDTTANYSRSHHGIGSALLWYYAFRPYGRYGNNGNYTRAGYYSGGISERSNTGSNAGKSGIVRGGFGHGSSVSS